MPSGPPHYWELDFATGEVREENPPDTDVTLPRASVARLSVLATRGARSLAGTRRGGRTAATKREKNRGRLGWRKRALALDAMMDEREGRKGRGPR